MVSEADILWDPFRPFVIIMKDYEEGSRAMWREYERFYTMAEARTALRQIRENQYAHEDRTGDECMIAYKIAEQDLS